VLGSTIQERRETAPILLKKFVLLKMNHLNRKEIAESVFFNSVQENRFKTIRISAVIFMPLRRETAAANALVQRLLVRSTQEYPDFTVLSKKLCSLYGASLSGNVKKTGDIQVITLSIAGIADRYTFDQENLSEQLAQLLCSVIFAPRLLGEAFFEEDIMQEKRQLLDLIDSEFNDKRIYASLRATEIMCKNEIFGLNRYGMPKDINSASSHQIYEAWKNIIETGVFNFMYVGGTNLEKISAVFQNCFKDRNRNPITLSTEIIKKANHITRETEEMEVSQSKLMMGFRTELAEPEDDVTAMRLMSVVLGGGAQSKLFKNVREKLSLCYYCFAKYDRAKGIMFIDSGIESANVDQTQNAVLKELGDMQKGIISDSEIEASKLLINNTFFSSNDTVYGLENWYTSQLLDKKIDSTEEACQKINNITKEQIISAANKVTLDTVYVLQPLTERE